MLSKKDNPAFIFGMFETGLGIGRSLGRNGIEVFGFDYKKDIGAYSKYINFALCPNPLDDQQKFIEYVISTSKDYEYKPLLYIASDEYLEVFSRYRLEFDKYLLMNLPDPESVDLAFNKNQLYKRFINTDVDCPTTFNDISECTYPLIIKANNVNVWRNNISGNNKVIIINNYEELCRYSDELNKLKVEYVLQEIIPGNDDKFFKYNTYRSNDSEILAEFMLQKLRQNPVRFGVGSLVKSIKNEELRTIGRRVFEIIDYKGVGSAEFKYDERDNKYKLIEINSRYWQQNILPSICGINFPMIEYLYLTNSNCVKYSLNYTNGIKWVNIYMDFSSFLKYRKEGKIGLFDWIEELKGEKVFSDFASDDLLPGLYELFLSNKLKRIPKYFANNV
jgi:D-aspartate ligase